MKYQELMSSISGGKIAPVYFFSGEEDFLKEEAVRKIVSSRVKPSFRSFDLDVLYGDDVNLKVLKNRAETPPLASEQRVVVLRNLEALSQGDRRALLTYLDSPPPMTCLVLIASKVDLKRGFYKDLAQKTESVIFWKLFDRQIPGWVVKYLKERNLSIEEEALYLLQSSVGNDLFSLANELDKVSVYVGEGEKIGVEGIKSVVGSSRVDSVFDLNHALGSRKLDTALRVIGNLIDWGESPNRIIAMVSRHLLALKTLKRFLSGKNAAPGELARKIGVPTRYVRDYVRQAENLSDQEIDEGIGAVYRAEVALKSSRINERLLLELMATSICQPELCKDTFVFGFGEP